MGRGHRGTTLLGQMSGPLSPTPTWRGIGRAVIAAPAPGANDFSCSPAGLGRELRPGSSARGSQPCPRLSVCARRRTFLCQRLVFRWGNYRWKWEGCQGKCRWLSPSKPTHCTEHFDPFDELRACFLRVLFMEGCQAFWLLSSR